MKDQYFSKIYRGFLVQQTANGWVIPQLPTWSNGPVSQGPYGTYQIACHVLDRVLSEQDRGLQFSRTETKRVEVQETYHSDSSSSEYYTIPQELVLYLIAYPLIIIFALSGLFTVLSLFGKNPVYSVLFVIVAVISFFLAGKAMKYVES